jgi:hypothetical protein
MLALGIVIVCGFLGSRGADPLYDAAAWSICSTYAADKDLELNEATGSPTGRRGFAYFPDYSCQFTDSSGTTVFVDENDRLIEPTWTYRGLRAAGWLSWVLGLAVGVGISAALRLLERD